MSKDFRKIESLENWDKNPRGVDKKDFERLKSQLKKYGQYKPLLVNKDGIVLGGNMRLKAMQDMGIKEVWVSEVDAQTEQKMVEYALSDNDRIGYYEDQALAELVASVPDIDLSEFKVDLGKPVDLEQLLQQFGPEPVEDEAPEVEDGEAVSKLGEIYQLGKHRVMCGDSTKIEDVERLMDGKKADMVFTDPPYGIKRDKGFGGFSGFGGFGEPIARRQYEDKWDSERPSKDFFDYCLILGEKVLIFGGNFFADLLPQGKHWIVWDKLNTMPTFGDCELIWTNMDRDSVKKYTYEYNGLIGKEKERYHPTQKPVNLIKELIENYSKENQIITDPFLGSGSTLIACEQTNRICYGMELDNKYIDVIIKRWQKFTNQEAVRISDGVTWKQLQQEKDKIQNTTKDIT